MASFAQAAITAATLPGITSRRRLPSSCINRHFQKLPAAASSRGFKPISLFHRNRASIRASLSPSALDETKTREYDVIQKTADEGECSPELIDQLIEFLKDDLPHLFDEKGITKEQYEKNVQFRDPITNYDSIDGYLFNIQMLRYLFSPKFELHSVKQTGPCEITTRWTMTMNFALLPWRPELIFTGISVMGVNPNTGKFISHVDYWDSINNNEYLSTEAVMDLLKQLRYYKTPDLGTPKYSVLKRTGVYEIREYEPFLVVESQGDRLTGNKGFKNVTDYIFGNNSSKQRIPMTTPVITRAPFEESNEVSIQIVLPLDRDLSSLPAPVGESVNIKEVSGCLMAALKFSGETTEEFVKEKEKSLRSALLSDGLNPSPSFMLARYNDPGRTRSFIRRNEVLIPVEGFNLD